MIVAAAEEMWVARHFIEFQDVGFLGSGGW
jgi:hypothetical protein